jgi:hypothetical protein
MAGRVPFDWKGWLCWVAATMVGAELVALIVHFLLPVSDSLNLIQQLGAIALIGMPGPVLSQRRPFEVEKFSQNRADRR